MNMRLYMVFAGALTSLALVACSSDTTDTGAGGTGNTAGAGVGGTGNTGNEGGGGNGTGATGGGGGAAGCRTCSEYVTDAADQQTLEPTGAPLCDARPHPDSKATWDALLACGCMACLDMCPDAACPGGTGMEDTCGPCLTGTFTGDCSMEFGDCSNDAP